MSLPTIVILSMGDGDGLVGLGVLIFCYACRSLLALLLSIDTWMMNGGLLSSKETASV